MLFIPPSNKDYKYENMSKNGLFWAKINFKIVQETYFFYEELVGNLYFDLLEEIEELLAIFNFWGL